MILCETLGDICVFPIVAKCCCLSDEIVLELVTTIDVTLGTGEVATLFVSVTEGSLLLVIVDEVTTGDGVTFETVAMGDENEEEAQV